MGDPGCSVMDTTNLFNVAAPARPGVRWGSWLLSYGSRYTHQHPIIIKLKKVQGESEKILIVPSGEV